MSVILPKIIYAVALSMMEDRRWRTVLVARYPALRPYLENPRSKTAEIMKEVSAVKTDYLLWLEGLKQADTLIANVWASYQTSLEKIEQRRKDLPLVRASAFEAEERIRVQAEEKTGPFGIFVDFTKPCSLPGCEDLRKEYTSAVEAAGGASCAACKMVTINRKFAKRISEQLRSGK